MAWHPLERAVLADALDRGGPRRAHAVRGLAHRAPRGARRAARARPAHLRRHRGAARWPHAPSASPSRPGTVPPTPTATRALVAEVRAGPPRGPRCAGRATSRSCSSSSCTPRTCAAHPARRPGCRTTHRPRPRQDVLWRRLVQSAPLMYRAGCSAAAWCWPHRDGPPGSAGPRRTRGTTSCCAASSPTWCCTPSAATSVAQVELEGTPDHRAGRGVHRATGLTSGRVRPGQDLSRGQDLARPGPQRTSTPAARSASLTWPTVSTPKWNTLAASSASAPACAAATKCSTRAGSPARDQRHRDLAPHVGEHLEVEARRGAVGVHRVQQHLAGAELDRPPGPLHRVDAGTAPTAVRGHLVPGRRRRPVDHPARVDREHEHLAAEPLGDLRHQLRARDRGGVHPDLVRARAQQAVDVLHGADPTADGERDEDLLRGPPHDVVGGLPVAGRRGDVEEGDLVRALGVVAPGQLHRVARRHAGRRSSRP